MMELLSHHQKGARPMLSITQLHASVERLLTDSLEELAPATRQRLLFFLIGVLLAGTLVLRRIATTHATIALSRTSAASHERRLRRTLNEPVLGVQPMYGRVVRRVLRRL